MIKIVLKNGFLEQPAEGPNGKCNNVENQIEVCKPGEDECPLDKNCSGKWGLCDQNCLQTWRLDRNGWSQQEKVLVVLLMECKENVTVVVYAINTMKMKMKQFVKNVHLLNLI